MTLAANKQRRQQGGGRLDSVVVKGSKNGRHALPPVRQAVPTPGRTRGMGGMVLNGCNDGGCGALSATWGAALALQGVHSGLHAPLCTSSEVVPLRALPGLISSSSMPYTPERSTAIS